MIRVFDPSHMEIQSISGQVERAQVHGPREKHEIYLNSGGWHGERMLPIDGQRKSVSKLQVCVDYVSIKLNRSLGG